MNEFGHIIQIEVFKSFHYCHVNYTFAKKLDIFDNIPPTA